MEMKTIKGLELMVIVGLFGWFYLKEKRSLQRLKEEREAKSEGPAEPGVEADKDGKGG